MLNKNKPSKKAEPKLIIKKPDGMLPIKKVQPF